MRFFWRLMVLAMGAGVLVGCASVGGPAPVTSIPASPERLVEHINAASAQVLPKRWAYLQVFDVYRSDDRAAWARSWTRKVDTTGIAWDEKAAGTLISPKHIVFATHRGRGEGQSVVFHGVDGEPVRRTVVAVRKMALEGIGSDVAIGLLDEEVDLRFYKVLPPREDYGQILVGATVFQTDGERKLLGAKVQRVVGMVIGFTHSAELPAHVQEPLVSGDSSNPSFVLIKGEPVLVETHTFGGKGGAGPFYGNADIQDALNAAMLEMDDSGYQLTQISLD